MRKNFLFILLVFFYYATYAQDCFWLQGAGSNDADSYCTAVDKDGNVYAAGYFKDHSITFGSIILTEHSVTVNTEQQAFIVKYNPKGNVLWAKNFNGKSTGRAVAVDSSGSVYFTGNFLGDSITFGTITLTKSTGSSSPDIFIVKLDENGNIIWAKKSSSTIPAFGMSGNQVYAIATDKLNGVYITGYFGNDTLLFGNVALYNPPIGTSTRSSVFVVKYDSAGNAIWGRCAVAKNNCFSRAIAVDSANNIFIAGDFNGDSLNFGNATIYRGMGNKAAFIVKFDPLGNTLWAKSGVGSTGGSVVGSIYGLTTVGNDVIVAGSFGSDINFGGIPLVSAGSNDLFICKINENGTVLWSKKAGGTNDDNAYGIIADKSGNFYLTGYFKSASIAFDGVNLINSGTSSSNTFLVKYDLTGNAMWGKSSTGNAYARSIAVTLGDHVFITGYFNGSAMSIGNEVLSFNNTRSVFIANTYAFSSSVFSTNVTCNGGNDGAAVITLSGGSPAFTYTWSNGSTASSVSNLAAGNYFIIIHDDYGCAKTELVAITEPPADSAHICLVSVDSISQNNIIVWDKTVFNSVDTFIVYREIALGNYQPIASIPFDSLSQFIDTVRTKYFPNTGNPNAGTYRYKLQAKSTCGSNSSLSPYHNTIFIQNNAGTFYWVQPYSIENGQNPVSSYVLMRDDNSNGQWHDISSVSGTQQTVSDPLYVIYQNTGSWRVRTQWNITCTPTLRMASIYSSSLSNIFNNTITFLGNINSDSISQIYPNPSTGAFTIQMARNQLAAKIEIIDVLGNVVFSKITDITNKADVLLDIAQGVYLVSITTSNVKNISKLIIR
ncbi:MAG: T9SS type A sorting domain-containing protein [Bacteroidetes bacterium]|nr:T9SS type A sorting domain-containing protein [Bacteroidota bacterium]